MSKILAVLMVLCGFTAIGCEPAPDLPPCGPGTYEFRGICLPTETEPPCGPGTHEVSGICIADPVTPPPPAKTLVCGEGTYELNGKCVADSTPPPVEQNAQFIKAEVVVSADNPTTIVASYELTIPARVYYKSRFSLNDPWVTLAFENVKNTKSSCAFGPVAPNMKVFWRMEAKNDDDKVVDTREGGLTTPPPPSTLTVSASPDTPSSQTLVMGTTNVELLRFKFTFNSQEDVTLDTITIKNDNVMGGDSSLKNFKLMNGLVQYTNIWTMNGGVATFGMFNGGMSVNLGKGNYVVSLNVKADITAYDDGGLVSFGHRLRVTGATATTKSGAKVAVTISTGANEPVGNSLTIRRAKLSVAWAADSPSGEIPANNGLVIAKFVATNSANVGNYSASVDRVIMDISAVNMTLVSQNTIRVYADSVYGLLLATYAYQPGKQTLDFKDWNLPNGSMSKLEVPAGKSRTFLIVMDLAGVSWKQPAGNIWVSMLAMQWSDGVVSDTSWPDIPSGSKCLIFQ